MTFKDSLVTDAENIFCNADEFAEEVTYIPHRFYGESARSNRTIDAVVMREQITVVSQDGSEVVLPVYQVHVANSTTTGIASTELDLGGDAIELPPRDGKTAEQKKITQLLFQDEGMLVVECR